MNIYFSGIGGVGIGPLAEIAHDAGHHVTGSDQTESLQTAELARRGISVAFSQDGKALAEAHKQRPIDVLVHTAALPHDHPELVFARQHGIPTQKRDWLLAQIITQHKLKLIAIAGTHGKTSTTSMMIWALQQLGIATSYSVGSQISFGQVVFLTHRPHTLSMSAMNLTATFSIFTRMRALLPPSTTTTQTLIRRRQIILQRLLNSCSKRPIATFGKMPPRRLAVMSRTFRKLSQK